MKEAVNSGLDFYENADWDSMRLAEIISAAELDPVVLRFALENGFDPERMVDFYGQEYRAKDRLTSCVMGDVWFGEENEGRAEETYRMLLGLKPNVELEIMGVCRFLCLTRVYDGTWLLASGALTPKYFGAVKACFSPISF